MYSNAGRLFRLFGAALLLVSLGACTRRVVDGAVWPKELVFAYFVDDELPGLRYEATAELSRHLSDRLGVKVTTRKSTQYGPIIEAMRSGKVDISMLGTFSYVLAAEKAGAECIIARETDKGSIDYHSIIIARSDRGIADFEDLKRRSKEFSFAFTNPASTSGHLIPRSYLEKEGIFAERDFRELVFPGKHNATLLAVLSGQIDCGCVSENTFRKLLDLGRFDPNEIRILWTSPAIPDGCIAVRKSLPEDLKRRIQETLAELPDAYPEVWEKVRRIYQYSSSPDGRYRASSDERYDEIRELAARLNKIGSKD